MEKKLNKLQIFCCKLIGWNPEMLANCGEASFRTMKKFVGSIVILSIIWGTIGYCFADRYVGVESVVGRGIVAAVFITIIICIERFIILNDDGKMVFVFRVLVALLMSTLGSTIFDQLIFKRDVEAIMKEVRTEQINEEVPKRMNIVNAEIERTSSELDSLGLLVERLNEKLDVYLTQINKNNKSLIEMVEALDTVTPGIANDHTLFYGVEAKFYSDRPVVDKTFETSIQNLYVGGDGAGITRGLAQAGANGVKIARVIIDKKKK